MPEFMGGALFGLALASSWQLASEAVWGMAIGCGVILYLLSCAVHPFRERCPRCQGDLKRGDGLGNYRMKNCMWCDGGRYVRFGARLMGR